jgi:2-polyprenyl-3-methyl-5-hydroxy-6-metoxy-1,4-benzoquinol methylase
VVSVLNVKKNPNEADDWNSHWSDQQWIASVNPAQKMRHKEICARITKLKARDVLDVGCGQGDLLVALSKLNRDVSLTGCDPSLVAIESARLKAPEVEFICADLINEDPRELYGKSFDTVTLVEVIEHLDNPSDLLKKVSQYMKLNATLIVSVPAGPRSAFEVSIGHRQHFSKQSLMKLLIESGFKEIKISQIGFPFFSRNPIHPHL